MGRAGATLRQIFLRIDSFFESRGLRAPDDVPRIESPSSTPGHWRGDLTVGREFPAFQVSEGGRMLILTRRPVETIYIGDEVTVTVLGVVGNQVRFGIEAPRSIVIDRAEIHERKKRAALANGNVSESQRARPRP